MNIQGNCSIEGHCIVDNHKIAFNSQECLKYSQEKGKSKDENIAEDLPNIPKDSKSAVMKPDNDAAVESFWTKKLKMDKSEKGKTLKTFSVSDPSCK